jgi:hypothetical protein
MKVEAIHANIEDHEQSGIWPCQIGRKPENKASCYMTSVAAGQLKVCFLCPPSTARTAFVI